MLSDSGSISATGTVSLLEQCRFRRRSLLPHGLLQFNRKAFPSFLNCKFFPDSCANRHSAPRASDTQRRRSRAGRHLLSCRSHGASTGSSEPHCVACWRIRQTGMSAPRTPADHRGVEAEERDALKAPRLPFRLRRSRRKSVAERLQAVVTWIVSKILRDLFQGPDTGPITGTDG